VLALRRIRRGGSRDGIRWLKMPLVWGLYKSRDASQPVNLLSVNLRWSVEWFWAVVYLWLDHRKSYAARVDIFTGILPRTLSGRRSKDFWGLSQKTNKQTNKAKYTFSGFITTNKETKKKQKRQNT